jgi:hypothetical protein
VFGIFLGTVPTFIAVLFLYAWFMPGALGGGICSLDPENAPSAWCLENIFDWAGEVSNI